MAHNQQAFRKSLFINQVLEQELVSSETEMKHLLTEVSNAHKRIEHMEAILEMLRKTSIDWHKFIGAVRRLEKIEITGLDQLPYLQNDMIVEALNNGLIMPQKDAQRLLAGMIDVGMEI